MSLVFLCVGQHLFHGELIEIVTEGYGSVPCSSIPFPKKGTVQSILQRIFHDLHIHCIKERMGIESVSDTMKWNRLKWLEHVLWKDDDDWVKKIMFEVEGKRGWGRPRMTWSQVVERDMGECRSKREDAKDRERWRRLLCRAGGQPLRKQRKLP